MCLKHVLTNSLRESKNYNSKRLQHYRNKYGQKKLLQHYYIETRYNKYDTLIHCPDSHDDFERELKLILNKIL